MNPEEIDPEDETVAAIEELLLKTEELLGEERGSLVNKVVAILGENLLNHCNLEELSEVETLIVAKLIFEITKLEVDADFEESEDDLPGLNPSSIQEAIEWLNEEENE